MKDYWRTACRVQNILMFGMGFACMASGWNDMTRVVFCVYYAVAGIFLAVGIGLSTIVTANEVKQSVKVYRSNPSAVPSIEGRQVDSRNSGILPLEESGE
jgi:hypothetical protein